jgi:glycosyltransferase involved in cell wall biosynthesis
MQRKVAFIATVYKHLADFSMPHMKLLQSEGYEIHIFANEERRKVDLLAEGFICHDLSIVRKPLNWANLKGLVYLYKAFKDNNFHIIHCHTAMGGVLGRFAAKLNGLNNVYYTVHGFFFYKNAPLINWIFYYTMERFLANWTDYLVVVNKEDFNYAKNFGVRKQLIHIPEHTYFEKYQNIQIDKQQIRQSLGISNNTLLIAYVAEFIKRKNQIQLIKALKKIEKADIKVLFAGDGEDLESMKKFVSQENIEGKCLFLGFRRDIAQILSISDMSILLSYHEGLPVCLLESLSAGKPIIASDIRGNKDLVDEGVNGFLVDVDDFEATSKKLLWAVNNRDKLLEMGVKSQQMASQYDINNILPKIKDLYKIAKDEN